MTNKVEELIERLETWANISDRGREPSPDDLHRQTAAMIRKLQASADALAGALRFYATEWRQDCDAQQAGPGVWDGGVGEMEPTNLLLTDKGDKARATLLENGHEC